mmetsp:Transcript_115690/g.211896  ORF Transcript_115690/g.211896 Transcript_115690/m.211896 type:complete len:84 (-) Transcript_115690:155-406(-)
MGFARIGADGTGSLGSMVQPRPYLEAVPGVPGSGAVLRCSSVLPPCEVLLYRKSLEAMERIHGDNGRSRGQHIGTSSTIVRCF